jgi:hypothetical protein
MMVIRVVTDLGELVKMALKGGLGKGVGVWGRVMGLLGLWPLCLGVFLF